MFCSARSFELNAVMLMGVACTVESRFSAVTTISSRSPPDLAGAGSAGPAAAGVATGSAAAGGHIDTALTNVKIATAGTAIERKDPAAPAAYDGIFIAFSP
jgi:hypothetical protein